MTRAGVSGSDIIWKAFKSDWLSILGKHGAPFLHTADAISRKKDFEGWDEVTVDTFISDCVSVIEKHASVRRGNDWLTVGGEHRMVRHKWERAFLRYDCYQSGHQCPRRDVVRHHACQWQRQIGRAHV